jgi:hypothetical protein
MNQESHITSFFLTLETASGLWPQDWLEWLVKVGQEKGEAQWQKIGTSDSFKNDPWSSLMFRCYDTHSQTHRLTFVNFMYSSTQ